MKKLMYLAGAVLALGMTFTSCGNETPKDINDIVENGFYVVGDAVGIADLATEGAGTMGFGKGINEVTKTQRDGMYEKYVVLEGGKDFQFINKEGQDKTYYGAELSFEDLPTDGVAIPGYKGKLVEGVKMQVRETGLYHIVLDLDQVKDDKLPDGPMVVLAKVEWGVSGGMNNWGYTVAESEQNYTWTWTNQELSAGDTYKFKHNNIWKINLDDAEKVKAETSLGKDMKPIENLSVEEAGLYTLTLTFAPKGGEVSASFSYTATKTGEKSIVDYTDVELELVGDAIPDQEGATKCSESYWNWGNTFPMGKPSVNGYVYTWNATLNLTAEGGFKARTLEGATPGFDIGIDGGNATVAADGAYQVIVTIDANDDSKKLEIVPADAQGITVAGIVPEGWEHCSLWAWYKVDGVDTNVFSSWPGQELTIENGVVTYTFAPTISEVYIIFNNGTNGSATIQTNDLGPFTENTRIVIADNIKP